jgi:hypothetical protein
MIQYTPSGHDVHVLAGGDLWLASSSDVLEQVHGEVGDAAVEVMVVVLEVGIGFGQRQAAAAASGIHRRCSYIQ